MKIEMWDIDRPKDYPGNARKWSSRAIEKVGASIKTYKWRQPVVVDKDGVIVIGHLRRAAGKSIGETQCPVHVALDLTAAQIRGLRLADNRTNQESDWDIELLAAEFADLQELDFDLTMTGFDSREIDSFTLQPNAAEDDLPPVLETPVSRLGDLWLGGPHRVLCGDATSEADVARLLDRQKPFLMVTDPPYGVGYDPEWRKRAGVNNSNRMGTVSNDDRSDWREAWALFPGDVAYVWHGALHAATVAASLEACNFQIRSQVIWAKPSLVIGRGHYHWQHEPCWYAVRTTGHWNGDRKQSTLWAIENRNQDAKTIHSTQKPVELMRRPILNHTKRGELVYEPFLGSGTTLAAAEVTERVCCGMELDPKYIDVVVLRWQALSNQEARLDGDGRTFAEISLERNPSKP
jgi:DNA modification methylase